MEIKWRISGEREKVKQALDEWIMEFGKVMMELSQKNVSTPFGNFPVPVFLMNYEEDGNDYILKANIPLPELKGITKTLFFMQIRNGEKQLKKFFEKKGLQVKIKRI
jgi:hypothetical protein